ncbi:MAG: ribbon-helix-helix domain-containing protein [bacterium]
MKRITITVNDEQEKFIQKKSDEFGNRSKVIRAAIERLRRQQKIDEMQNHYKNKSSDETEVEKFGEKSWEDLPDY